MKLGNYDLGLHKLMILSCPVDRKFFCLDVDYRNYIGVFSFLQRGFVNHATDYIGENVEVHEVFNSAETHLFSD